MKPEVQAHVAEMSEHLVVRLTADDPNRALLFRLETQTVEMMQRVYYFAKKIAKETVREVEATIEDPVTEEELASAQGHSV